MIRVRDVAMGPAGAVLQVQLQDGRVAVLQVAPRDAGGLGVVLAAAIVILLGLAGRTANKSRKHHYSNILLHRIRPGLLVHRHG